jgi:hypothetical protein
MISGPQLPSTQCCVRFTHSRSRRMPGRCASCTQRRALMRLADDVRRVLVQRVAGPGVSLQHLLAAAFCSHALWTAQGSPSAACVIGISATCTQPEDQLTQDVSHVREGLAPPDTRRCSPSPKDVVCADLECRRPRTMWSAAHPPRYTWWSRPGLWRGQTNVKAGRPHGLIGLRFLLLDRDSSQDRQIGLPELRDSL